MLTAARILVSFCSLRRRANIREMVTKNWSEEREQSEKGKGRQCPGRAFRRVACLRSCDENQKGNEGGGTGERSMEGKGLRSLLSGYNHVERGARGVSHAEAQTRCWMLWGGTWGGEREPPEGEGPRGSGN